MPVSIGQQTEFEILCIPDHNKWKTNLINNISQLFNYRYKCTHIFTDSFRIAFSHCLENVVVNSFSQNLKDMPLLYLKPAWGSSQSVDAAWWQCCRLTLFNVVVVALNLDHSQNLKHDDRCQESIVVATSAVSLRESCGLFLSWKYFGTRAPSCRSFSGFDRRQ